MFADDAPERPAGHNHVFASERKLGVEGILLETGAGGFDKAEELFAGLNDSVPGAGTGAAIRRQREVVRLECQGGIERLLHEVEVAAPHIEVVGYDVRAMLGGFDVGFAFRRWACGTGCFRDCSGQDNEGAEDHGG